MSSIFGGGTSKASEESLAAQSAANAATQAFIERQSGQARADVMALFPQAQEQRTRGFEGALDILSRGIDPRLAAFQQGNIGAQGVVAGALPQIQNAILGRPLDLTALQPQPISVDTSFLSNLRQV